jgi:hypothetical protein
VFPASWSARPKPVRCASFRGVSCGVIATINEIMGIIQGIKILRMSDEEFAEKKEILFMGVPSGK